MWRPVKGFEERYLVSNLGRVYKVLRTSVKNAAHRRRGIRETRLGDFYLKPSFTSRGYYRVNLHFRGMQTTKLVHRLVAEAFVPNPSGFPKVTHCNGNRADNRASNLQWMF